jgi:CDP-glucose 4,6-dehydratase
MDVTCITGGTGFIGSHLARVLPDAHLFDFPRYDLRSLIDTRKFIEKYQPEVVFHLAAQSVVTNDCDLETLDTNIDGTYNLLHSCRRDKFLRSFVHVSTDKVYGYGTVKRDSPLRGTGHPYNASKLCGDVIAQMYSEYYELPVHIVRTGNIYGPGDMHFDRIVPGAIKATLAGKPMELRSNGNFIRDYIYIDDLIPAYLKIADEPPGIYNLGGESWSVIDLVRKILQLMGREDLQPIILNNQKNELKYQRVMDCPKWWQSQVSLEEGLMRTISWYSNRKDLR